MKDLKRDLSTHMKRGRAVDLRGQRFGKLTAIEPTERRANGYVVWLLRCDCGAQVERYVNHLLRRDTVLSACERCLLGPAGRRKDAVRGTCSWCKKPTKRWPFECDACNRKATRNGRLRNGRPKQRQVDYRNVVEPASARVIECAGRRALVAFFLLVQRIAGVPDHRCPCGNLANGLRSFCRRAACPYDTKDEQQKLRHRKLEIQSRPWGW